MKSRIISLILAGSFTLITLFGIFIINIDNIRWDKIPIIKEFVLQIELAPSGFDASGLSEPIRWDQLDKEPDEWNGYGRWFSMNPYTKKLLKRYMMENNLGIVPDDWPDFKFRSNLEECLQTFDFVELDESYRVEIKEPIAGEIFVSISGVTATALYIMFFIILFKKKYCVKANRTVL